MCDTIILPDGTEIDQLPLPYVYTEKAMVAPTHTNSCLCQFPKKSIEVWLKKTYPNCEITYDVGFGEWKVSKK